MMTEPYKVGDIVPCYSRYGEEKCYVRIAVLQGLNQIRVQRLKTKIIREDSWPAENRGPGSVETTYEVIQPWFIAAEYNARLSKEHEWSFNEKANDSSSRIILSKEPLDPIPKSITFTEAVYF